MNAEKYQNLRNGMWDLFNLASRECEVPVIWKDQDGKKPDSTYVTLKMTLNSEEENPEHIVNDDGNFNSVFRSTITMSVQTWGKEAEAVIMTIRQRIQMPSWRDDMTILLNDRGVCAGIYDVLPIQNLTELLETSPEERRSMDVLFRHSETIIDEGSECQGLAIEKLNIKGTYQRGENDLTPLMKTTTIIDNS